LEPLDFRPNKCALLGRFVARSKVSVIFTASTLFFVIGTLASRAIICLSRTAAFWLDFALAAEALLGRLRFILLAVIDLALISCGAA
jgi:hypothetical protein